MKSIKIKVIVLVLSCVLLSSLAIGVTGMISSNFVVMRDSKKIMNLLCDNKAEKFNEMFDDIEQSVDTLANFSLQEIMDIEDFQQNQQSIDEFTKKMIPLAIHAANESEGAIAVYIRTDPSYSAPESGLFYVWDEQDKAFKAHVPTDLNKYGEQDAEYTKWFYEAKEKREALWLEPYINKNTNDYMISYVVPLYYDDTFLGVVGMDISYDKLKEIVADTAVYNSGYAFLTNNLAEIVYHNELEPGTDLITYDNGEFKDMAWTLLGIQRSDDLLSYTYNGIEKKATFRVLKNGMRFILAVPQVEIQQEAQNLLYRMLMFIVLFTSITALLAFVFAKRMTQPLLEITRAAKKIGDGDLSVEIKHQSKDEVGILADSFRHTVTYLEDYFTHLKELAYKDSLTGVKNKTAYLEKVEDIENKLFAPSTFFSIIIFDLNDLKSINDTYGHDTGDLYIIAAVRLISGFFHDDEIYRIGGDEFVVLMENDRYQQHEQYLEKYLTGMEQKNNLGNASINVFVAGGIAHYDIEEDKSYLDVFQRADMAMYECKARMKYYDKNEM